MNDKSDALTNALVNWMRFSPTQRQNLPLHHLMTNVLVNWMRFSQKIKRRIPPFGRYDKRACKLDAFLAAYCRAIL